MQTSLTVEGWEKPSRDPVFSHKKILLEHILISSIELGVDEYLLWLVINGNVC